MASFLTERRNHVGAMARKPSVVEMQFTNLAGELKSVDLTYERFKESVRLGKGVDGVFEMKVEEETSGLARYIRISKMMGVKHSTAWTKFDIDESKGILKST